MIVLTVFTIQFPLRADPISEFPKGELCKNDKGETKKCFTLDEVKYFLNLKLSNDTLLSANLNLQKKIDLQVSQLKYKDDIIFEKDQIIVDLQKYNTRLFDDWSKENKLRHEAENRPNFGSWVAWGTAAGFAGTSLLLLGALIL